jgi:hypothetical protein
MSKFGSKEEILASILVHFENLNAGVLSADELESLVSLTRELHERTLILRYKSYEEKVFGVVSPVEAPIVTAPEETEVVAEATELEAETPIFMEEIEQEILAEEPAFTPAMDATPVFDFDMFEKAEVQEEAESFSLASPTLEEEEIAPMQTPVFEEELQEIQHFEADKITTDYFESELAMQDLSQDSEVPEANSFAIEEPVAAQPIVETPTASDSDLFKSYVNPSDDSLNGRLMSAKLETLVGAFGLNDKLQCIRELFNGSSEAFNQAIELLDNQADFSDAKQILIHYAKNNSWDLESNLTADFIQKVERRYL